MKCSNFKLWLDCTKRDWATFVVVRTICPAAGGHETPMLLLVLDSGDAGGHGGDDVTSGASKLENQKEPLVLLFIATEKGECKSSTPPFILLYYGRANFSRCT